MINILKSKLRAKLLTFYFNQPGSSLYIRELAKEIKEDPTNLQRELIRLEDEGIFVSERRGKERYFKLNTKYIFYNELKSIITKTVGIEKELGDSFKNISGIKFCFIFGSYANGQEKKASDVDLLVVADKANENIFVEIVNNLEKKIKREINYRIFSSSDFLEALKEKNSFINNIIKNKKIFITGNEKDFRKFIKSGVTR